MLYPFLRLSNRYFVENPQFGKSKQEKTRSLKDSTMCKFCNELQRSCVSLKKRRGPPLFFGAGTNMFEMDVKLNTERQVGIVQWSLGLEQAQWCREGAAVLKLTQGVLSIGRYAVQSEGMCQNFSSRPGLSVLSQLQMPSRNLSTPSLNMEFIVHMDMHLFP